MIDPARLLADLQRLLKRLEDDIRGRVQDNAAIDARLQEQYDNAKAASRTAQAYEVWRDDYITQVAVAWILGCVFVRFLEDNGLIQEAWLSGAGERLQLARDQHTLYFQRHPSHSDREYLEHVFAEAAKLPSMRGLLDGDHNPLTKLGPTGDGAHELREFWQKIDPATGKLIHDFTDPDWNTRFLGDLYQDLSETARDRYALLQTPEFVEEFILDRTLNPAIAEFGYATVKMIDPTCGSGHFLLGGFRRLLELRLRHEPGVSIQAQAQAVLNQVYGIDVNPFAVAIARFRLLTAALRACGVGRLSEAPAFRINLATGDSLLHGPRLGNEKERTAYLHGMDPLQHLYETEDADELRRILGQQYQVVVGNPPYIVPADPALRAAYRERFGSCHGQYSLVIPFMERFFHLCMRSDESADGAGFAGMITANSFMRREFGKKLIKQYFQRWNLTHVVDTSRAFIPGHGTPTVILFATNRPPVLNTVRTVSGIRAESRRPEDPSRGLVWSAIIRQIDQPGSQSEYVSVTDAPRQLFSHHPWSLGGGGAMELKVKLDRAASVVLEAVVAEIGRTSHTGEDEVYYLPSQAADTLGITHQCVALVTGEDIRDYEITSSYVVVFPYQANGSPLTPVPVGLQKYFWPYKVRLRTRIDFGKTLEERNLRWFDHSMFFRNRYVSNNFLAYTNVATHNHFVVGQPLSVFNSHAPTVQLKPGSPVETRRGLLGLLNSSIACFWMKQVFHNKGGGGIGGGLATEEWEQFFDQDGTKLKRFPVPDELPCDLAQSLEQAAAQRQQACAPPPGRTPSQTLFEEGERAANALRERQIALQEELDWHCYRLYGLLDHDLTLPNGSVPPIRLGERAFEILLARKMAAGELETTWFDRHRSTPTTEIPCHWPEAYRQLVERRLKAIESDRDIALVEQPEYKRRWSADTWEERKQRFLQRWLLRRMEDAHYWSRPELASCANLADRLQADEEFRQVAELYRGRPDFDWTALITELVEAESVPFLAVLRYTDSGLRKRAVWDRTWELQRAEDHIDDQVRADASIPENLKSDVAKERKSEQVGDVPVPPKYDSKDFRKSTYWGLRGKLDVPKERFVSFPHGERDVDPTPVIAWAGWDHLQLARAIAAYYERVKNQEGWTPERRVPLLAGILELLPWLKQWHNDIHPEFQERMGDFFEQFVQDEARSMEMTVDQIRAWSPPVQTSRGRRRRNS